MGPLTVEDEIEYIKLVSTGKCSYEKLMFIGEMHYTDFPQIEYNDVVTGCLWRHLTNISLYNSYYGETKPYVLEYPFAYKYNDEILQNVKEFSRCYQYLPNEDGVFSYNTRIEVDKYFDHAVLYNGQQSSGMLNLVEKPLHNMKELMSYPKFYSDSKSIVYTKCDSFYNYNDFWNIAKDPKSPMFKTSCESLSVDKVINDENMDYSTRSFRKDKLRAKDLKIRHILQDSDNLHIVSQFILGVTQISFK